ncbi:MAG: DNA-binding transcriptional regulator [Phycisphaerae bacterium]
MATPKKVAVLINTDRPYLCDIIRGVMQYSQQLGHWKFYIDPFGAAAPDKRLKFWGCDGVIVYSSAKVVAESLKGSNLPAVMLTVIEVDPGLPRVAPDHLAIGRLAADHLIQRGFKNFAYWQGRHGYSPALRGKGFMDQLAKAGMASSCSQMPLHSATTGLSPQEWGQYHGMLREWVLSLPKPVGILCSNDIFCRRLAVACESCGLRVPEDVALVGVDNEQLICEFSDPPLSSVDPNWGQVGYEAAAMLDRIMSGQPAPQGATLIPPLGLIARQSTNTLVVDDPVVSRAIKFIRDQANPTIRISEVLKHVGVSRRSLEQRFKAAIGRGPVSEIRRTRVDRAKDLLAQTHMSIAQIAKDAGFSNAQSLCVIFRREVGLPPTTYRKQFQAGRETRERFG